MTLFLQRHYFLQVGFLLSLKTALEFSPMGNGMRTGLLKRFTGQSHIVLLSISQETVHIPLFFILTHPTLPRGILALPSQGFPVLAHRISECHSPPRKKRGRW